MLNMEAMHAESNNRTPLICFLSMGSDPTENIMSLAKKLNYSKEASVLLLKCSFFFPFLFLPLSIQVENVT